MQLKQLLILIVLILVISFMGYRACKEYRRLNPPAVTPAFERPEEDWDGTPGLEGETAPGGVNP